MRPDFKDAQKIPTFSFNTQITAIMKSDVIKQGITFFTTVGDNFEAHNKV